MAATAEGGARAAATPRMGALQAGATLEERASGRAREIRDIGDSRAADGVVDAESEMRGVQVELWRRVEWL